MKRTKEQRLKKYWKFKINPITGIKQGLKTIERMTQSVVRRGI